MYDRRFMTEQSLSLLLACTANWVWKPNGADARSMRLDDVYDRRFMIQQSLSLLLACIANSKCD